MLDTLTDLQAYVALRLGIAMAAILVLCWCAGRGKP